MDKRPTRSKKPIARQRAVRDAVRFGSDPYSVIAANFNYKDRSGPLRAAQYFEKMFGLGPSDPSPEISTA